MKEAIAEAVGTFALVFIGVGAIASSQLADSGLVGIALAHGLTIAVMVSATGAISGGALNPAVSIGLWVTGKLSRAAAIRYIIAECIGAIAAALLLVIIIPDQVFAVNVGTPALAEGINPIQGILIEAVTTFFLMFVIYGTAVDARAPKMAGLFIGLTVTLDILMAGPLTGAAMNPARHLGPALFSGQILSSYIYWIGPIAGAVGAALLYHHVLDDAFEAPEEARA